MKKTIKMPDGSEVVIEGTPEEVDEFERRQKIGDVSEYPKKGKKKLLLEEQFAEMMKKLDEIQKNRPYPHYEFHSHCVGCALCKPWNFSPFRETWPWPATPWVTPYRQQPWNGGGTWTLTGTVTSDNTVPQQPSTSVFEPTYPIDDKGWNLS